MYQKLGRKIGGSAPSILRRLSGVTVGFVGWPMPTPQKKKKQIRPVEGTKIPDSIQYGGVGWVYKGHTTFEGGTPTYQK
jgi:hypothetical protein